MDCCLEIPRHLPADFADRLIARIRTRRRVRRAKVLALVALLVVGVVASAGFFEPEQAKGTVEARLVAADAANRTEKVTGWMLLGVFRECFRRMKASKRKEDEQDRAGATKDVFGNAQP